MIPILAQPKEDEILSSWIIRNSISNGSDPMSWTAGIWFEWRVWTLDIDRHIDGKKLVDLSKICGISADTLYNMTLEPSIKYILETDELNTKKAWSWIIPTGIRNRNKTNGLHFCPKCLEDKKSCYMKKDWRFSWNVACQEHGNLLSLQCPECNQVFSPHLIDYKTPTIYNCTRCGYDLRKVPISMADSNALSLQNKLNNALKDKSLDNVDLYMELKQYSVSEFFSFVRDTIKFFRNFRRQENKFFKLLDELEIEAKPITFKRQLGSSIDSVNVIERHYFMSIAEQFLQLDYEFVAETFRKDKIYHRFIIGEGLCKSLTMKELIGGQPDNLTKSTKEKSRQSVIVPRSKQEVEEAMDYIRSFL